MSDPWVSENTACGSVRSAFGAAWPWRWSFYIAKLRRRGALDIHICRC